MDIGLSIPARGPMATLKDIRGMAEEHDRDPATIGLAYYVNRFDERTPATAELGERQLFTGTAVDMVEDIEALGAMGFTDLVLDFQRGTLEKSLHSMQWFTDEVRAAV